MTCKLFDFSRNHSINLYSRSINDPKLSIKGKHFKKNQKGLDEDFNVQLCKKDRK